MSFAIETGDDILDTVNNEERYGKLSAQAAGNGWMWRSDGG